MSLFASHLRFKSNNPSTSEICRFWVYLLLDNLTPICNFYGVDLKSLESFKKHSDPNQMSQSLKPICDFLLEPSLPSIIYSHLFIKQQLYGNGK